MQAIHDIIRWGRINSSFDHLEFPGVVPRSFIGPLMLSALSYPAKLLSNNEGMFIQVYARAMLGLMVVWANSQFRQEIKSIFGQRAANWYGIFCLTQFHFTFWTSRMLGNTLALVPMLVAQKLWLRTLFSRNQYRAEHSYSQMAAILAFTCVVLRFDSAVFALAMIASKLDCCSWRLIKQTTAVAATSIALSLAVDSYYWQQRWMWPEFHVFWFNTVLGRSSEWGTLPAHYYFTGFIPRLLLGALPFACLGIIRDTRAARLAAYYAVAVSVFSMNAHKEWRFIFPAVPLLNLCAALGVSQPYRSAAIRNLVGGAARVLSAASLVIAVAMTYISSLNYPGGHALAQLHAIEPRAGVRVHIDTFAAMTGVTRFGQLRTDWVYDKTEGLDPDQFGNFTHLLTSQPELHTSYGFKTIAVQTGYAGLSIASNRLPISIRNYSCYGELVKEIRLSLLAGRWEKVTFELMSPLLKSCINLTVLDMNLCSNIRSTEFIVLFVYNSQMCQSLKYLDIRETGLSPEAMAAGIMMMPNLELLDVSDTEADNKLLIALAQSNPQLKHLSLDRCIDVTDQGIELLVEKCKNLEVISIKNCPYIGNYAVMDDHNIQVEHEDNSDESWSDESWSDN
ncbi:alpha-1,6- mannosyltransferase [Coemansia sp. RSA 2336]|nr:alpha-1,6- mannosyltransferase [Coemansia sp. RSA 2336]